MNVSRLVHYVFMSSSLLFAFLTLAFSIAVVSRIEAYTGTYSKPSVELLAASVILLVTSPLIIIPFFKHRAPFDRLWFEIGWVFINFALFIGGAGAVSANWDCDGGALCNLINALQAFAWMTFIMLFFWLLFLLFKAFTDTGFGGSAYDEEGE